MYQASEYSNNLRSERHGIERGFLPSHSKVNGCGLDLPKHVEPGAEVGRGVGVGYSPDVDDPPLRHSLLVRGVPLSLRRAGRGARPMEPRLCVSDGTD